MKTLSLKQPWATMIAVGAKTIETRMWSTKYRGPLLIVASKKRDLELGGNDPTGCAICLVNLVDCRLMTPDDEPGAGCLWERGRFAWVLKDVRQVKHVPVKGQLSIFEVDDAVVVIE